MKQKAKGRALDMLLARRRLKLKQKELAFILGVKTKVVMAMENGRSKIGDDIYEKLRGLENKL